LRQARRLDEICVVQIRSIRRIASRHALSAVALVIAAAIIVNAPIRPIARAAGGGVPAEVSADDVFARVAISAAQAQSGRRLGVTAEITIAPGWHIYGEPLPDGEGLTPTAIVFDNDLVASQSIKLPAPTPLKFATLNLAYPVYTGTIKAAGSLTLKPTLAPGDYKITGTLNFQECNDSICKMPQAAHFELPIHIAA
jgi:DsbC/DsbD-like thiol-disulfide interchange protein